MRNSYFEYRPIAVDVQYRPGRLPTPIMLYSKCGKAKEIEDVTDITLLPMGEYEYAVIVGGQRQCIYRSGNSWFERSE